MRVHGSCHCGAITYEADVDPALVGVCSCTDCGAPVHSSADLDAPPLHMLRVGCLAERAELAPHRQIWRVSAVPWVRSIPDLPGPERQ